MKIMKKLATTLSDDYVVELLSEQGDSDCLIGWGPDVGAARRCYDATVRQYPHTKVRLRQGAQPIALRVPNCSVPRSRMH
jgi:hypothetical protein